MVMIRTVMPAVSVKIMTVVPSPSTHSATTDINNQYYQDYYSEDPISHGFKGLKTVK